MSALPEEDFKGKGLQERVEFIEKNCVLFIIVMQNCIAALYAATALK